MTTRFNRVLFDYDGTLIIHDKENQGMRVAEILKIHEEQKEEFVKRLTKLFWTSYGKQNYANKKMTYELYCYCVQQVMGPLREFGITVQELDKAINENVKTYSKVAPNAREVLEYLQDRGYTLCVFTNGFYSYQAANMKFNGLYDYFERIYAWDNCYAKPDKRAFRRALAGSEPNKNILIADSIVSDIAPAKDLGIYTVGYNLWQGENTTVKPDVTISDLSFLKAIL